MKKKDVINFAPTGVKKKRRLPVYVGFIVLACIATFVASVFVILAMNDFDIGKALGARQEDSTTEEPVSNNASVPHELPPDIETEQFVFLVLCSDKDSLVFSQLIFVEPAVSRIRVRAVDTEKIIRLPSGEMSLNEAFRTQSFPSICDAFSEDGITVHRYVHVTEENYRIMLSNLGTVPVNIDEYCEFNIEAVKYSFEPGVQNMTSDMLIKFMKYAKNGPEIMYVQAEITACVLRQHCTYSNFEKGEGFFSSLINSVDSNITAFDYGAAKEAIGKMLSGPVTIIAQG